MSRRTPQPVSSPVKINDFSKALNREFPKSFMISLARTPDRLVEGLRAIAPFGFRTEILAASDGYSVEASEWPKDPRTEVMLQKGELGSSMSVWRTCCRIVRDNLPWGIMFEDDVEVLREDGLMEALDQLPHDFHIAYLHDSTFKPPVVESMGPGPWRKVREGSYTTVAMLFSNEGARRLIKSIFPLDIQIDAHIARNRDGLNMYMPANADTAWFTQSFWKPSTVRANGVEEEIPKIIHRVWIGDKPIPQEFENYWESWKKFHPGWEFRTWRDYDIPGMSRDMHPAFQSDIIRYHVLRDHGGFYADTDFECFHSFEDIRKSGSLVVVDESNGNLCNGFLGAAKGHALMRNVCEQCLPRIKRIPDLFRAVGPGIIQDMVKPYTQTPFQKPLRSRGSVVGHAVADTGIVVLAPKTMFPYYWGEHRPSSYNGSWAAHHWNRSWWTENDWQKFYKHHPQAPKQNESDQLRIASQFRPEVLCRSPGIHPQAGKGLV